MLNIEYLTDGEGQPTAVVIPIELWRQILPQTDGSLEDLTEGIEAYCLSKAMDEAKATPLLSRDKALRFLEIDLK